MKRILYQWRMVAQYSDRAFGFSASRLHLALAIKTPFAILGPRFFSFFKKMFYEWC